MAGWISIDVGLPRHRKIAELPNDAARYGWIVVLCEAKLQRPPGRFASARHFRAVLNGHAKYLPHYLATGLLEADDDGSLLIHDWQRYQWAVQKARQRDGQSED